ncbi:MAG: hypothetical protein ACYSUI_20140 [Planctomycetota bacterium]
MAWVLALAHKIDGMIRSGVLRDMADAAKALRVSRARISQIMSLLLLASEIQEAVLDLPPVTGGRDPIGERQLRAIVAESDWGRQMELWSKVCGEPCRLSRV